MGQGSKGDSTREKETMYGTQRQASVTHPDTLEVHFTNSAGSLVQPSRRLKVNNHAICGQTEHLTHTKAMCLVWISATLAMLSP